MRFRFLVALLFALTVGGAYWYLSTAYVCPAPLQYRLGQLDDHFNINREQAIAYMERAERVWENDTGRDLFVYDESADFVIDFVFDDRQAMADNETALSASLDSKRDENETLQRTIEELQQNYQNLSDAYNSSVRQYEERLQAYNQTVSNYNDRGGAPESEYGKLQREQEALDREVGSLQVRADEINTLANRLNELGNRSNELIEAYNKEVQRFNKQFGYTREFTQGDYQGDRINIYKFSSDSEIISVLTHEFGHALGIDHVESTDSVMYYLLIDASANPVLSEDDKAAFITTCGTGRELSHTLRRFIREAIALIY